MTTTRAGLSRFQTAGLITAGVLAGAVLAGGVANAATTTPTPATSTGTSSSATTANGASGSAAFDPGGSTPVRSDEKSVSSDVAAKLTAAALAEVPGATVIRAETDAGDAAYEVHLTKSDGTLVTVKLDDSYAVTAVEDGMGLGDPAPSGADGTAPSGAPTGAPSAPANAPSSSGSTTTG